MENKEYNPLSLAQIRPYLAYRFKNETELHNAIEEVGKLFNFERDELFRYRTNTKLVSAYSAFWLTTNYPKLFAVAKLLKSSLDLQDFERIIDVGTGPGTFLLGLSELCSEQTELMGIDISDEMLNQAHLFLKNLRPQHTFHLTKSSHTIHQNKKTLLLFTHSLNEMSFEQALEYIERFAPESILFIEPGTKSFFAKALKLRAYLLHQGFKIAYPCMGQASCPMDPTKDWCHQFVKVTQAQDVESLTQKLHRDRKLLPLTLHLYHKGDGKQEEDTARIVRVHSQTKHSFEWSVCAELDGSNQVKRVELPKRGLSKFELKRLSTIMAGERISYRVVKRFEDRERIELV